MNRLIGNPSFSSVHDTTADTTPDALRSDERSFLHQSYIAAISAFVRAVVRAKAPPSGPGSPIQPGRIHAFFFKGTPVDRFLARRHAEPAMIDAQKYPRTAQYLDSLPNGISSYPECRVKVDARQDICEEFPEVFGDKAVPPILRQVVTGQYSDKWMPEVIGNMFYLMVRDAAFKMWRTLHQHRP